MPPGFDERAYAPGASPRALARSFSWRNARLWKARFAALSYETGFRKSKLEDVLGMIGNPRADDGKPGDALSFIPGLAHSPATLSLSGRTHRLGIDRRIERITTLGAYLERKA